MFTLTCKIVME